MSTNSQTGDQDYRICNCGNCMPQSYVSPTFDNDLSVEERVELIELRDKVKIYEGIANPDKYSQIWHSAFYSGVLAQKTGETTIADMEKYFHEDMESIIREELSKLELSEEYNINGEED